MFAPTLFRERLIRDIPYQPAGSFYNTDRKTASRDGASWSSFFCVSSIMYC